MHISIHFQQIPATSLHTFVQTDLLQEEPHDTPPLCFHEREILYTGKNHEAQHAAPFAVPSHSISMLVKAIGTS